MTEKITPADSAHPEQTVLIVDDDEQIGRAIGRLLKRIGVKFMYVTSGSAALEQMKDRKPPFSLILTDQRMPGMLGTQFLEKAKHISPDTIRYLITGYSDVRAIQDAVNKGAIHRYIAKPWDNDELMETIRTGLEQYAIVMENHRLFTLAKKQNTKLYTLNLRLKESTRAHKKTIAQLDRRIRELKDRLEKGSEKTDNVREVETLLKQHSLMDAGAVEALYPALLARLCDQFQQAALQEGFDISQIDPASGGSGENRDDSSH